MTRRCTARFSSAPVLLFSALLACAKSPAEDLGPPARNREGLVASGVIVPFETFGTPGSAPGANCAGAKYREFDLWLGNWDITNASGSNGGVSVISSLVSGCALLEYYNGGAGQSLNVFDAHAGKWNQLYVFTGGGVARLRGGLVNGEMVLEEQRGTTTDRWTWTELGQNSVRQRGATVNNGVVTTGFDATYTRRSSSPTGIGPSGNACASPLAFTAGNWDVFEGDPEAAGTYRGTVNNKLEILGCVLIERVEGASQFTAISFNAVAPAGALLIREYVDSDGRYLRLVRTDEAGKIVLTGTRNAADGAGDATARITIASVSATEYRQSYEISRDGGATWSTPRLYTYLKY